jgi:patatin-like phospholipase/acyl hydrolase
MNLLEYPTTRPGTGTGLETNNNNDDARKNQGLCLLSLDGGGVRGLSTLLILRGIMNRLNDTREEQGLGRVKPCEVFDLIGGTSTGGYVQLVPIATYMI